MHLVDGVGKGVENGAAAAADTERGRKDLLPQVPQEPVMRTPALLLDLTRAQPEQWVAGAVHGQGLRLVRFARGERLEELRVDEPFQHESIASTIAAWISCEECTTPPIFDSGTTSQSTNRSTSRASCPRFISGTSN